MLHSHRLFLSIGKPVEPKKEWILNYKKFSKIFNYSLLTSFQIKKNHLMMEHFFCNDNCYSMRINDKFIVKKIYINTFMIWNKISSRYFNLNYEIVGVLRRIISSKCLKTKRNVPNIVWCFHGGAALKVNYHIIRNKLMFSVNAGVALSDINNIFYFLKKHLFDKTIVQNRVISKFAFSKNYTVDFLLFREILKGISDAKYLASNITYNISNKLDFIFSTIVSSSNLLKNKFEEKKTITIEVDLSSTFKMLNGFYVTTKFAWLIPFLKLNYLVFFEDINKEKFLKKSDIFQIFKVSCSIGTRF